MQFFRQQSTPPKPLEKGHRDFLVYAIELLKIDHPQTALIQLRDFSKTSNLPLDVFINTTTMAMIHVMQHQHKPQLAAVYEQWKNSMKLSADKLKALGAQVLAEIPANPLDPGFQSPAALQPVAPTPNNVNPSNSHSLVPMAPTAIQPTATVLQTTPVNNGDELEPVDMAEACTELQSLERLGKAVEVLYREHLGFPSVQYMGPAINHLRVIRLIFKCKIADFIKFRNMSSDTVVFGLRYLGIENPAIIPGTNGVFELQIPKPEKFWESLAINKLLDYEGKTISQYLPVAPPKIPIGVDLQNERVYLDLLQPILYAGMTRSGKSNFARQLILQLMLRYKPEHMCLVLIDLRYKTFAKYKNIPHLWNNEVVTSVERALEVFQVIMDEYRRRDQLFAQAGVDNLWDYNAALQKKGKPMLPIWMVDIEEIDCLKYGQSKQTIEQIDNLIAEGVRTTSGNGILWCIGAHTPTEKSVTTTIRDQCPNRLMFHSMQHASEFIMDVKGKAGQLGTQLVGKGDAWVLYTGRTPLRCQTGLADNECVETLTGLLRNYYQRLGISTQVFDVHALPAGEDVTTEAMNDALLQELKQVDGDVDALIQSSMQFLGIAG